MRAGVADRFTLIDKKGIERLLKSISGETKVSGRVALGIIVDANNDIARRWQAITDQLKRKGIEIPPAPPPGGLITSSRPRVGVWVMPDNERKGMLEDFVADMISQNDAIWPLAKQYIISIPENDKPTHEIKAQIHAWLAAKPDKPQQMGAAIGAKRFDIEAPLARDFIAWVKRLVE